MLMGLQFKIAYRKGKENVVADALSRVGHLYVIESVSSVQPQWIQELLNAYATDPKAQELLTQLAVQNSGVQGYTLEEGVIRYKNKLWVANNTALHTKIISAFHASPIGGHSGVQATYQRVKQLFFRKGLKGSVDDFVKQCAICQQTKHSNTLPT